MTDLARLREIAEKSTPGVWEVQQWWEETEYISYMAYGIKDVASLDWYSDNEPAHTALDPMSEEDAEFIATFNPQQVLGLLDRLERAEGALMQVRAVCEKADEIRESNAYWTKRLGASVQERTPGLKEVLEILEGGVEYGSRGRG